MSAPNPVAAPPKGKPGTLAFVIAAAILSTIVVTCGGMVVAVLFYASQRVSSFNARVDSAIQQAKAAATMTPAPPPPPPPAVNDWWSKRALAPVYTVALDAVAADPQVALRLGETIEPLEEAEELYRVIGGSAMRPGELPSTQTMQFEIKGPKGSATVSVVASGGSSGIGYGAYRTAEIIVNLADGSTISVPIPKEQPGTQIQ